LHIHLLRLPCKKQYNKGTHKMKSKYYLLQLITLITILSVCCVNAKKQPKKQNKELADKSELTQEKNTKMHIQIQKTTQTYQTYL